MPDQIAAMAIFTVSILGLGLAGVSVLYGIAFLAVWWRERARKLEAAIPGE